MTAESPSTEPGHSATVADSNIAWDLILAECIEYGAHVVNHPAELNALRAYPFDELEELAAEHQLSVVLNPGGGYRFTRRFRATEYPGSLERPGVREIVTTVLVVAAALMIIIAGVLLL